MPFQLVRISGPSMVPTLRHGDLVVVQRGARVRMGDVVLAAFADVPERFVVKRFAGPLVAGACLLSDNPTAGGDSRTHGPGTVLGRVSWRIRRGRPSRIPPLLPPGG